MAKIAVLGGTFNPIHNGHLYLADRLTAQFGFDQLLFMPTNLPPHKRTDQLISPLHRLQMCRLAVQGHTQYAVSSLEIARGGASYTYQTLQQLHDIYPSDRLYWLMGSDMLLTLDSWAKPQIIYQLATICAIGRHPSEEEQLQQKAKQLKQQGACVLLCMLPPYEISSTQIRQLIAQGKPITGLVPAAVEGYIIQQGLYRKEG